MKPEIYMEMNLIFDNDYDVYELSDVIGIQTTNVQRKKDTRINSISQEHNPGFWSLKTETFYDYDIKTATNRMFNQIKDKAQLIKEICENNQGEVIFDVVISFCANEEPAIYFEKDFIELVHYLNAQIQLDLYTCDK